tara:strand:+ start:11006 stop:11374 length:369 start_codon:yes stop_codon:yes gene_type:complete
VIKPTEYKTLADDLGNARGDAEKAFRLLQAMQGHLSDSEIDIDEVNKIALRNSIELAYFVVVDRYFNPHAEMKSFVTALQSHVTQQFGSVNTFLKDNKIQVLQEFADISATVGFNIDLENII